MKFGDPAPHHGNGACERCCNQGRGDFFSEGPTRTDVDALHLITCQEGPGGACFCPSTFACWTRASERIDWITSCMAPEMAQKGESDFHSDGLFDHRGRMAVCNHRLHCEVA